MTGHRNSALVGHLVCKNHVLPDHMRTIIGYGLQCWIGSGAGDNTELAQVLVMILDHVRDVLLVELLAGERI